MSVRFNSSFHLLHLLTSLTEIDRVLVPFYLSFPPLKAEGQIHFSFLSPANLISLCHQPKFIKTLSDVLANPSNDVVARSAAGLQLKNSLTAKDNDERLQVQERWLKVDLEVRNHAKRNVVSTLGTESSRPSAAAQCVAYIAVIELPHRLWLDLIETLCMNITNSSSSDQMKESTLEAISYICQDCEPETLVNQSNLILTAIVHGMRREEPNNNIKVAATTALLNSLEFTKANFERDAERNFIMQVVCEATQSEDLRVCRNFCSFIKG